MKSYQTLVREAIDAAQNDLQLPQVTYELNHPSVEEHGDVSANIALKTFPLLRSAGNTTYPSPLALAQALCDRIPQNEIIATVEAAAPGFVNVTFTTKYLLDQAQQAIVLGQDYGKSKTWEGKKVIVEYSSPNIAKPFTVGHLRSTIIGDAIASLLEFSGARVWRDNHIGDWGTQFGKQIYALKHLGKGDLESNISAIKQSTNPVKALVALYVEFHQKAETHPEMEEAARAWFKKLESGDEEARRLWQLCVAWSWQEFELLYQKLGVKNFSPEFNKGRGLGESFFENKMEVVVQALEQKGLLQEGEHGAKLVFFPNDVYPPAMILKKDGATLYHTRDLATDWYRKVHYDPDLIINEVGAEQSLYFQQLFEIEHMLGWFTKDQRKHIAHGLIRFNDQKMSTRKGNTIWLEDVLAEATSRAQALAPEANREQCQSVGVAALKWNDLKRDPKHQIVFDWDELLSMDGNAGPYMQYTHARLTSVLKKAQERGLTPSVKEITLEYDFAPQELSVLRGIYQFPHIIENAAQACAPHLVCGYLYTLAQRFNAFYNQHSILGKAGEENEAKIAFRLMLTKAVQQILHNGLLLLGIKPVENM